MVMCWAENCNHYNVRQKCRFFRFPKNPEIRSQWIKLTSDLNTPRNDTPSESENSIFECEAIQTSFVQQGSGLQEENAATSQVSSETLSASSPSSATITASEEESANQSRSMIESPILSGHLALSKKRRTVEPGPGAFLCSCHFVDEKKENGPVLLSHSVGKPFNCSTLKRRTSRTHGKTLEKTTTENYIKEIRFEPQPSTSKQVITEKISTPHVATDANNYFLQQNLREADRNLLHLNEKVYFQNISHNNKVIFTDNGTDQSTDKRKLKTSAVPRLNLPISSNNTDQGVIDLVIHTSEVKEHFPYLTSFLQDDQLPDYVKDLYKNVYKCCKMVETSNNKPQVENQQLEMPNLEAEVETNNIDNQENISPPNLMLESSSDANANKSLQCIRKMIDAQPERLVNLCKGMNNFDKKLEAIDRGLNEYSESLNELE